MKRILASCAFLFPISRGFALYNGCPSLPGIPEENLFWNPDSPFSLKATYEGDLIFARKIHTSSLSDPNMRSLFNGGEVAFGMVDRFELYTLLGGFSGSVFGSTGGGNIEFNFGNGFGGEIGVRAVAFFFGDWRLGVDAKYFYGWPRLQTVKRGSERVSGSAHTSESEWQVGISIAQTFGFFHPYLGGTYSRYKLDFSSVDSPVFQGNLRIKNSRPFGLLAGLALGGEKGLFADLEIRFLSEYGFSWTFGIRF